MPRKFASVPRRIISDIRFNGDCPFSSMLIEAGIPDRSGQQSFGFFLGLQRILSLPQSYETVLQYIIHSVHIRKNPPGHHLQLLPKPHERIHQIVVSHCSRNPAFSVPSTNITRDSRKRNTKMRATCSICSTCPTHSVERNGTRPMVWDDRYGCSAPRLRRS